MAWGFFWAKQGMAEILPTSSLWFQLEYLRGVEQSQCSGT